MNVVEDPLIWDRRVRIGSYELFVALHRVFEADGKIGATFEFELADRSVVVSIYLLRAVVVMGFWKPPPHFWERRRTEREERVVLGSLGWGCDGMTYTSMKLEELREKM